MLSERLTCKLEAKLNKGLNFGELGFIISLLVVNAISTNDLIAAVRAVLVAPRIVEELVPILLGLIAIPFCIAIMTVVFNGTFLALSGGFLQGFARMLLVVPSDPQNLIYYGGMICSILGHALIFTGMFGLIFKDIKVKGTENQREIWATTTIAGMLLGFGLNIVIRMPGIAIVENILVNALLSGLLVICTIIWYLSIEKKHNVIKNLDDTAAFKKGKEKRFGKTLHVLLLGPCFAIFGITLNRYEWLAAATAFPYSTIAYILFLSIMVAPVIDRLVSCHQKGMDIIIVSLLLVATVGLGLVQILDSPWLVLIGMLVAPTALFMAILQNIKLAKQELVNNMDITIILSWIVAIASLLALAVLSLLLFFPYAILILLAPVLAQEIIRVVKTSRKVVA